MEDEIERKPDNGSSKSIFTVTYRESSAPWFEFSIAPLSRFPSLSIQLQRVLKTHWIVFFDVQAFRYAHSVWNLIVTQNRYMEMDSIQNFKAYRTHDFDVRMKQETYLAIPFRLIWLSIRLICLALLRFGFMFWSVLALKMNAPPMQLKLKLVMKCEKRWKRSGIWSVL